MFQRSLFAVIPLLVLLTFEFFPASGLGAGRLPCPALPIQETAVEDSSQQAESSEQSKSSKRSRQQEAQQETDAVGNHQWRVSKKAAELGFAVEILNEIDAEMLEVVESGKVVGCSALVLKGDKELLYGEWGLRDRGNETPIERDTIFRIYSMSKPITSVAAMQLVEKGKLELDKPVHDYLPEFKDLKVLKGNEEVEPERPMTVRDLLRHTSGLTYGFFGNTKIDQRYRRASVLMTDKNIAETVTKLGKIPLLHEPGERFHYSVSTDVVGRVIEVASGMSFKEYLEKNIFEPLKMEDTFFTVPKQKLERLAELYRPGLRGKLRKSNELTSYRFKNDNDFYSGGGGLCSTLDDYAKFSQMLVNGGELNGARLLKEDSIDEMWKNQLADIRRRSKAFQFGLGFRIDPKYGDYGWGGAAGTRFWANRKHGLTILYMIQISPYQGRKHGDVVRAKVYEALKKGSAGKN